MRVIPNIKSSFIVDAVEMRRGANLCWVTCISASSLDICEIASVWKVKGIKDVSCSCWLRWAADALKALLNTMGEFRINSSRSER